MQIDILITDGQIRNIIALMRQVEGLPTEQPPKPNYNLTASLRIVAGKQSLVPCIDALVDALATGATTFKLQDLGAEIRSILFPS